MKVMPLEELLRAVCCPMCRGGELVIADDGARCERCDHRYGTERGVLSFLIADELSQTNQNEIVANTFDDPYWIEKMLNKDDWSPLLSQQMAKVIELVDGMLPPSRDLFVLGAGTGYDLQLLLKRRSFDRVFASDISPGATALIARALASYSGELGLFASEFGRCPVPRKEGNVGLVFQALHHAPDAHGALATLLDHNFDDLVIVEPVTNPPLGLLAKFDLVQRVEYSGTRPDWLHLGRVEALAKERGYKVASQTWWEIPPYFARAWIHERPWATRAFGDFVDVVSRVTNVMRFGSMAAIRFERT
ncbi:MAG TPA: class I SAM-dependent methyltransferase [Kofleriaceae bacterium]|nr:class I SAM-dependent methyltransferase [Kofleriaceae bacterium]